MTRPHAVSLLAATVLLMVIVLMPTIKAKREEAFVEDRGGRSARRRKGFGFLQKV